MVKKYEKNICLYLHAHQPYRLTKLNYLDLGQYNNYFEGSDPHTNKFYIDKISTKSYLPTNKILQNLLESVENFSLSLSLTGTLLGQLEEYSPESLKSFIKLSSTSKVEILSETYHHTLASIYSLEEFCEQIVLHRSLIKSLFNYETKSFRNTELIYNDKIASIISELGFQAIITEGWDPILNWKSSNFIYNSNLLELTTKEKDTIKKHKIGRTHKELKLLLKNYRLSDDLAFRFSNKTWDQYPLTIDKFIGWIKETDGEVFNLFMDYETFGEHQWEDSGIFEFLKKLPTEANKVGIGFLTISEAAEIKSKGIIEIENLISWADVERDLSAWLGNKMQQSALAKVYELEPKLKSGLERIKNKNLYNKYLDDWRKLQVSDHFYYMSTKYWSDGDVHKYFSPYDSPYEAFINYMNVIEDFSQKVEFELNKQR